MADVECPAATASPVDAFAEKSVPLFSSSFDFVDAMIAQSAEQKGREVTTKAMEI